MPKAKNCPSWDAYRAALTAWKADRSNKTKRQTFNDCIDAVIGESGLPNRLRRNLDNDTIP